MASNLSTKVATRSYLPKMRSVGIKVLKNKLSEYVRLAAAGETVLVTDHDRVVAELRPPMGRGPEVTDAAIADLVRRGLLTPARVVSGEPPRRRPDSTLQDVLTDLDASREER
jgi:antitoxin (DNA-binding transcriptional repressor) of toxin-antitoxin stability system